MAGYVNDAQTRADALITPGVPCTITVVGEVAWPAGTLVHIGPLDPDAAWAVDPVVPAITPTLDGTDATFTLNAAAIAAIAAAYPPPWEACPWHVRTGAGEDERTSHTGVLRWDLEGARSAATVTVRTGPPGPTVVSADEGNTAEIGSDGLLFVPAVGGSVSSVNGQTGAVVLDAAAVGAELAGTAAGLIAALTLDDTPDTATRVAMTPAERTKLAGVATGATANATDAQLRDRATHTGTQPSASLSDLTEVVQDIVAAMIVAGTNLTVSYNDAAGTFTINASTGTVTDPEVVRDTIGAALVAGSGVQITVNDAGDTITVGSTAVLPTRQVNAGTGLTGGGDLSANRTLSVSFGTAAGTAAEGNHTHAGVYDPAGTAAALVAAITPASIGAATAAQGALADTAIQPADLADVATSGAYSDLTGTPTVIPLRTIVTTASTSITAASGDHGKLIQTTAATAVTVELPAGLPVGTQIEYQASGAGLATFTLGASASWSPAPTPSAVMRAQGSAVVVLCVATNAWTLVGDLA